MLLCLGAGNENTYHQGRLSLKVVLLHTIMYVLALGIKLIKLWSALAADKISFGSAAENTLKE